MWYVRYINTHSFIHFSVGRMIFFSLSVPSRSFEYQVCRGNWPNNVKMEITPTSKSRNENITCEQKPLATLRVLFNSSKWQKIACNWYCVDIVHNKLAYLWDNQNLLLPNTIDTGLNCKNISARSVATEVACFHRSGSRGRVQGCATPLPTWDEAFSFVFAFKICLPPGQWCHSLEVQPLLRKILDPPLFRQCYLWIYHVVIILTSFKSLF